MNQCSSSNPVNLTLKVIGGKWKPLILWYLAEKTYRFSELSALMSGVTQKMLSLQLKELTVDKVVERIVYPVIPPKVEYKMTEYGKTLLPVLKTMHDWGLNHKSK